MSYCSIFMNFSSGKKKKLLFHKYTSSLLPFQIFVILDRYRKNESFRKAANYKYIFAVIVIQDGLFESYDSFQREKSTRKMNVNKDFMLSPRSNLRFEWVLERNFLNEVTS